MPQLHFRVRWPDGAVQRCYSPSTVVKDFLEPGATYLIADFVQRSRTALETASERVRDKYGYACGHAAAQLDDIEQVATRFDAAARVIVEAFEE